MRLLLFPGLLCCALLWGCGPATVASLVREQGAEQVAGRDMLQLVQGNTLYLHAFDEDVRLYFDPSGKVFAKGTGTENDKGNWDVSDKDELCFHLNTWWYGDLRCFTVYHVGDRDKVRLATANGVLHYTAEREPGDSKGLAATGERKKKSLRRQVRDEQNGQSPDLAPDAPTRQAKPPALIEDRPHTDNTGKDTGVTIEYMARDCPGCNLAGADLGRTDLINAKLDGADLHGANLSMANLRRADLQKADLREAVLTYANLPGADLRGADLRGAKLKGANLIKADLTGARLEGADLTEVLKDGAKGLK